MTARALLLLALAGCDHPDVDPWTDPASSGFDDDPILCCDDEDACTPMLCVDGRMICPLGTEPDGDPYWCDREDA